MPPLYQAADVKLSQGDIFRVAKHVVLDVFAEDADNGTATSLTREKDAAAIVLTHDCHIDKRNTRFIEICAVMPLNSIEAQHRNEVKKGKMYQFFHLPALDGLLPESFVDFGFVTNVNRELLKLDQRLTTLNDLGRRAFYVQYIRWITRWELRKMECPSCGTALNPAEDLVVRTD